MTERRIGIIMHGRKESFAVAALLRTVRPVPPFVSSPLADLLTLS
jgi:hypothetical protein